MLLRGKVALDKNKPLQWSFVTSQNILTPDPAATSQSEDQQPEQASSDSAEHQPQQPSPTPGPSGDSQINNDSPPSPKSDSSESVSPFPASPTDNKEFNLDSLFDSVLSQHIDSQLQAAEVHIINEPDYIMAESQAYVPGYFHGKDGEDPELFMANLTAYCALRNTADPMKILPLAFKDGARVWYTNLPDESKTDLNTFRPLFIKRYGPADITKFSAIGHIFQEKQKEGEKARDYVSRMTHLCSQSKLSDDMTAQALLNGLLPHLRTHVLNKDPKTPDDIEKEAIKAELVQPAPKEPSMVAAMDALREEVRRLQIPTSSNRERSRTPTPHRSSRERTPTPHRDGRGMRHRDDRGMRHSNQPRRVTFRRNNYRSSTCYRCGGMYSPSHNCKATRATCFNCGRTGHFRKVCNKNRQ